METQNDLAAYDGEITGDELLSEVEEIKTPPGIKHPWRRYFARTFDLSLYNTLWLVLLGLGLHINLSHRTGLVKIVDVAVVTAMMLLIEPFFLARFGTTPGKKIMGIKVRSKTGENPSYLLGFARTFDVIKSGMGFNIPIYNLIRLANCYDKSREGEKLSWEDETYLTIKDTKGYRAVGFVLMTAMIFAATVLLMLFMQFPPNRGDLSVEEFAHNFQYYTQYYEASFSGYELNDSGEWVKIPNYTDEDALEIRFWEENEPVSFAYKVENGVLQAISFEVEVENVKGALVSNETQMIISAFSFACAQDEVGFDLSAFSRINKIISVNQFKNFEIREKDMLIKSQVSYDGFLYNSGSKLLFTDDKTSQNHFKLIFTIEKVN